MMTHATPSGPDERPTSPAYGPPPTQQGYYQQGPPPRPKRKVWPWVVGGLVLVLLICGGIAVAIAGAGGKAVTDAIEQAEADQKGENAVAGTVGKATRDDNFEFTAHDIKCGVKNLGTGAPKPQGQFCLVKITVKNVGTKADFYDGSSQKAYDAKGVEYTHDSGAAFYANDDDGTSTFLEELNPGNKTDGTLVYDIPVDAKITSVVLRDNILSKGVRFTF